MPLYSCALGISWVLNYYAYAVLFPFQFLKFWLHSSLTIIICFHTSWYVLSLQGAVLGFYDDALVQAGQHCYLDEFSAMPVPRFCLLDNLPGPHILHLSYNVFLANRALFLSNFGWIIDRGLEIAPGRLLLSLLFAYKTITTESLINCILLASNYSLSSSVLC